MAVYDIKNPRDSVMETQTTGNKYKMEFSYGSGAVRLVMPHIQPDLEIQNSQANEIYNGLTMPLSMLGNAELRQISISTFLPARRYPWCDSESVANPQYYVDFFKTVMNKKIPMRMRLYCNSFVILDIPVCINAMNYSIQKNDDYLLALNLQEYPLVTIRKGSS